MTPMHYLNRSSMLCRRQKARGFTLIELMIAVAVIAILAAIAVPAYSNYVRKARRVDAKNAVLDMASRQEKFFSINNKYTTSATDLGYAALPTAINASGTSYYTLSVAVTTTPPGFVAKATPTGVQTQDTECYSFTVNQAGAQANLASDGSTALTSGSCW